MFHCTPGVTRTTVGYMGGPGRFPVYDEMQTNYYPSRSQNQSETVLVEYDPSKVRRWLETEATCSLVGR